MVSAYLSMFANTKKKNGGKRLDCKVYLHVIVLNRELNGRPHRLCLQCQSIFLNDAGMKEFRVFAEIRFFGHQSGCF